MHEEELVARIIGDFEEARCEAALQLLNAHPEVLAYRDPIYGSWLQCAAIYGCTAAVRHLAGQSLPVDSERSETRNDTPLEDAISNGHLETARALLELGADPNYKELRYLFSAITGDMPNGLEFVKLLDRHGVDLHRIFRNDYTNEPINALSMAQDWGKQDIVEYLLSRGCTLPPHSQLQQLDGGAVNDVIRYFQTHFGPVLRQCVTEIVPSEPPITVHVVPPSAERTTLVLFTSGMSAKKLKTPKDDEARRFQHAELYIELPGSWNYRSLSDPAAAWPILWLRQIAKYPHLRKTWLGGPATIFATGEPPEPIAAGLPFTSFLLLADRSFSAQDGRLIQLFRLTPLYPEERDLELRDGLPALMHAFDRNDTPFVVDVQRKNVALDR